MEKKPLVSIIIPCYNHAKYIAQRIESILKQSFQDFELILLDDCSTDDSSSILQEYSSYPKVAHLIINQHNSGSTFSQWDKGLKLAKGKYIWIAESDDYADENFLNKTTQLLDQSPHIGLCYCQSYKIDENGKIIGDMMYHTESFKSDRWNNNYIDNGKDEILNYLIFKNTIPNASAVLFRRNALLNIPKCIQGMKLVGDLYCYCNILIDWDIAYIADKLNFFRFHNSSVRNTSIHEQTIQEHAIGCSYINKKIKFSKELKFQIIDKRIGIELFIQYVQSSFLEKIKLWVFIVTKARMFLKYMIKMTLTQKQK